MLFLSNVLHRSNSKRLVVCLKSCVHSGYFYLTRISPSKAKQRMALRKYDPRADRHVIFYQTAVARSSTHQKPASEHSVKYAYFTGKERNLRPLISRVTRAYEYGRFHAFDKVYKELAGFKITGTTQTN